jgi:hypothetical protein
MKKIEQKQLESLYEEIVKKEKNFHYPEETTESAVEKYIKSGSEGHLYLPGTLDLISLPNNLKIVKGNLVLSNCSNLKSLPDNLTVVGNLNLHNCKNLKSLPKNLKVGGYLDLDWSGIRSVEQLPDDLRVVGPILSQHFSEEETRDFFQKRKRIKQMEDNLPELKGVF